MRAERSTGGQQLRGGTGELDMAEERRVGEEPLVTVNGSGQPSSV
jgi:hypothetical protein